MRYNNRKWIKINQFCIIVPEFSTSLEIRNSLFNRYLDSIPITRNRGRQCRISRIRVESVTETKSDILKTRVETWLNSSGRTITIYLL